MSRKLRSKGKRLTSVFNFELILLSFIIDREKYLSDRHRDRCGIHDKCLNNRALDIAPIKTKLPPKACTHVTIGSAYCLSIVAEIANCVMLASVYGLRL